MRVEIREAAFDPLLAVRDHQQAMARQGLSGALALFVGTMRDFNEGESVKSMQLEHYPGMTEQHMERMAGEAQRRWDLIDVLVLHRIGRILPGEPIVCVAAWAAHRAQAFEACRFLMEDLKARAPFWKKEQRASGERWVEKNTPGYMDAAGEPADNGSIPETKTRTGSA